MSRETLEALLERLNDRDVAVLRDVEKFRLLSTRQIQQLHFTNHDTTMAATRACSRVLARLHGHGLLACLHRRIGGVRRGSAGFVWHLGPTGERLLRDLNGVPSRRRYSEPSRHFVAHTLAVVELAICLTEAAQAGDLDEIRIETEPQNWQAYLNLAGVRQWLKPDLTVVASKGDFEEHWFVEADLATEHLPVVVRQCLAYQAFQRSGRYQAVHGVFPFVLWVAPDERRAAGIRAAIASHTGLDAEIFRVCTREAFIGQVCGNPMAHTPTAVTSE